MAHLDSRYTPPMAGDAVNHPGVDEPCALPRNRYPYGRVVNKTRDEYVRRVNARLNELVREGWLLPEYADEFRAGPRGPTAFR